MTDDEGLRAAQLLDAQAKAAELFAEVERRSLIAPRVSETQASDAIRDPAREMFGVRRFWHKRIVRAGVKHRAAVPAEAAQQGHRLRRHRLRRLRSIFEQWEADFGRTVVLGDDPAKHRICEALPALFAAGRQYFESHLDITGAQLFAHVVELSEQVGWEYGGPHRGHLVGRYPHEKIAGNDIESYIAPGSDRTMRRPIGAAVSASGSSRSTSWTGAARSEASTKSCSTWDTCQMAGIGRGPPPYVDKVETTSGVRPRIRSRRGHHGYAPAHLDVYCVRNAREGAVSVSSWPDPNAGYEYPGGDETSRQAWQQAVGDAQQAGKLTLHRSQGAVFYLEGICPRCGHFMAQLLDFSVVVPQQITLNTMLEWLEAPAVSSTFDIVCSCTESHDGRQANDTGCGWERGLGIHLQLPSAGRS